MLPGLVGVVAAGSIIDVYHSWTLVFVVAIASYACGALVWLTCARGPVDGLAAWQLQADAREANSGSGSGSVADVDLDEDVRETEADSAIGVTVRSK